MSRKDRPNYTELTHQVVSGAPEPLTFNEIVRRVAAIAPIVTSNPRNTIRGAVSQSRLIVATGDGRYSWKPRVITGSVLRHTLSEADLTGQSIEIGEELRDALWPSFFEIQLRQDLSPIHLELPDRTATPLPLTFLGTARWGTTGSPAFWQWVTALTARPGDHLIFHVIDGNAKLYGVEFQPRAARDEQAIAERNRTVVQSAIAFLRRSVCGAPIWDITTHLLATGQYRHSIPPDPLIEIWTRKVWEPVLKEKGLAPGSWQLTDISHTAELMPELMQEVPQLYDVEAPPDLPREYNPDFGRHPRPSRKARTGSVKTFTLRVNHRALPTVWRDIEIAEDQTLEDLHLAIQDAYAWGDDHLYSFFMSGRADDTSSEIGSPWSETQRHTHQVEIGSLNLRPRRKFLYFFDYGDSHEFDVQVLGITPSAPRANYPRVIKRKGKAPPQYPDYDEETGESEWDPYQRS